jgi:trimeric autotransporter adhesin
VRNARLAMCILAVCFTFRGLIWAQAGELQSPATLGTATVPRLIRIAGTVRDEAGNPLTGFLGITFTLYKDQADQDAVWQEVQSVRLNSTGHYSVLLGSTNADGLPLEIFSAGEARWLGVRPDGHAEQPRILFLSVAYALKAADTDMLGGKPASAFMLAESQNATPQANSPVVTAAVTGSLPLLVGPQASCSAITSDGTATANQVAKFTTACNIENSAIFESGGNVGIGNTKPAGTLDVSGTAFIRGSLSALAGVVVPPTGTATTSQGYISNPLDIEASVYNTTVGTAADYVFQWQAEPVNNDSSNTSATLNLLYGVPGAISETGVSVDKKGVFTFASGQTFPGTGSGTVTSVATGTGLTGGPVTSSGTISIPNGGVTNALLQNSSITVKAGSGLSGGGTVALGGTVTLSNGSAGTVTSVGTGAGLTGGPITTSGTISIPSGGVTNSMLANNAVTVVAGPGLSGGGSVALGGSVTLTGNLSGTAHGIGYFSNATNLISTPAPTNGQVLIGSTGAAPTLGTLTAGSNISITNGPGSITISASGGASPSFPFFVTAGERTGGSQSAGKNVVKLWGILVPYNVATSQVTYDVTTADDTTHTYDLGIFDNSGNLLLNVGPTLGTTFSPAKGFQTLPWAQGSTTLPAGRYYIAMTTNCGSGCAVVAAATTFVSFAIDISAGATSGGALPTSVTPPADSWATGDQPTIVIH